MRTLDYQATTDRERRPIAELLGIALPTVAQMSSYTVMQFIDTLMLSRLGPLAPAAATNGGMVAFCYLSFGMGVVMIVNALGSQSFGRGATADCGRFMWQGVWFGLLYSLLSVPLILAAPAIFDALGHPASMRGDEAGYFRILMAFTAVKLAGTAVAQFFVATDRPNTVMYAAFAGVAANTLAALPLVLGWWGAAPLGVAGAALAHGVGLLVETLVLVAVAGFSHKRQAFGTFDWRPRWAEFRQVVAVGFGSGMQFAMDVVAWTAFTVVVVARFGETAMAANAFMFRYLVTSFLPAVGISHAVTALVGRYVGAGRPGVAVARADLGFMVTCSYLLVTAILYVGFGRQLIGFFSHDADIVRVGGTLMIFAAAYQFVDAMFIVYNGALRGVGDTFVPALVTAGLCWGVFVGGGLAVSLLFPKLGVYGPWTTASLYGVLLGGFMLLRFRRGKWRTRGPADVAAESAEVARV